MHSVMSVCVSEMLYDLLKALIYEDYFWYIHVQYVQLHNYIMIIVINVSRISITLLQ